MKFEERVEQTEKFIKEFMLENGYTPTIREMRDHLGFKSTGSTYVYFKELVKSGVIEPNEDGHRYRVKGMRYVYDVQGDVGVKEDTGKEGNNVY